MTASERDLLLSQVVVSGTSRSFMRELCEYDVLARISHKELYNEYLQWCAAIGRLPEWTSKAFAQNMHKRNKHVRRVRGKGGNVYWLGVRMKTSSNPSEM
jgi:hypothetical protein